MSETTEEEIFKYYPILQMPQNLSDENFQEITQYYENYIGKKLAEKKIIEREYNYLKYNYLTTNNRNKYLPIELEKRKRLVDLIIHLQISDIRDEIHKEKIQFQKQDILNQSFNKNQFYCKIKTFIEKLNAMKKYKNDCYRNREDGYRFYVIHNAYTIIKDSLNKQDRKDLWENDKKLIEVLPDGWYPQTLFEIIKSFPETGAPKEEIISYSIKAFQHLPKNLPEKPKLAPEARSYIHNLIKNYTDSQTANNKKTDSETFNAICRFYLSLYIEPYIQKNSWVDTVNHDFRQMNPHLKGMINETSGYIYNPKQNVHPQHEYD